MRKKKPANNNQQPQTEYSEEAARCEFGRRLSQHIQARCWNQSDLARAVGLGRDSISTYIRGNAKPEPKNLLKICEVLRVKPSDLYPGVISGMTDIEKPVLEMKLDDKDPTKAWLRVNQKMTMEQASECLTGIMAILKNKPSK